MRRRKISKFRKEVLQTLVFFDVLRFVRLAEVFSQLVFLGFQDLVLPGFCFSDLSEPVDLVLELVGARGVEILGLGHVLCPILLRRLVQLVLSLVHLEIFLSVLLLLGE